MLLHIYLIKILFNKLKMNNFKYFIHNLKNVKIIEFMNG